MMLDKCSIFTTVHAKSIEKVLVVVVVCIVNSLFIVITIFLIYRKLQRGSFENSVLEQLASDPTTSNHRDEVKTSTRETLELRNLSLFCVIAY
jgi:hypothetical protein